jgi:hypothetical protein
MFRHRTCLALSPLDLPHSAVVGGVIMRSWSPSHRNNTRARKQDLRPDVCVTSQDLPVIVHINATIRKHSSACELAGVPIVHCAQGVVHLNAWQSANHQTQSGWRGSCTTGRSRRLSYRHVHGPRNNRCAEHELQRAAPAASHHLDC